MSEKQYPMKEQTYRTYTTWNQRRIPTTYDVATHRTNYDIGERYDGKVPRLAVGTDQALAEWYREYREGSSIAGEYPDDFDSWRDPREMTYEKYNDLMDDRESAIETLYEQAEVLERGTERSDDPWLDFQKRAFLPLRYPCHGLQMLASYLTMVAPSSTISTAMTLQSTDEIRRQERLARRASQLKKEFPERGFTENEREVWEEDELWQPFRKVIEELLVEYDWGKSFVGTNLVLKPLFDELFLAHYSELFEANDSDLYAQVLDNFYLDSDRSREIGASIAKHLIEVDESNGVVIQETIDEYYPACEEAVRAFRPAFESMPPETLPFDDVMEDIEQKYDAMLGDVPVQRPS